MKLSKKELCEGTICPCCERYTKMYKRKITSSMAYALILIYKKKAKEYFHVEDYLKELRIPSAIRGDFPKLRFWGLLEAKSKIRNDGSKRNGYYKITEEGIRFVQDKKSIQQYILLYNNKCSGFKGDNISIEEALGNKFNYRELMSE